MPIAQAFLEANYRGGYVALEVGNFNFADSTGASTTVSSFQVTEGYQVIAFAEPNGQGASQTFTLDTPQLASPAASAMVLLADVVPPAGPPASFDIANVIPWGLSRN